MSASATLDIAAPSHVPRELIKDFNLFGEEVSRCPFESVSKLHSGPRIFWSPNAVPDIPGAPGAWVVTKAEDLRFVFQNPNIFSSKGNAGFSKLLGEEWDLVPLEIDPPMHTSFRKLLNPVLYPRVVADMAPGVVRRADELIDAFADKGGCEFMHAFGTPFPISIFMQLMGLPDKEMSTFLIWEDDLLHSPDINRRVAAARSIKLYLETLAAERRADPKDDLASLVVTGEVEGRPFTDDEVIGALYLFFVGGLDTVASSLGWIFHYLATHPEQQQWLRDNPKEIPNALEELLRRFSIVSTRRVCAQDVELGGIKMKQGDWLSLSQAAGSLDPDEFENPMEVDFERNANRHFGFSFGPHFCIGSHLARREIIVSLERWFERIPPFKVKPGSDVRTHGSTVFGVNKLEIVW